MTMRGRAATGRGRRGAVVLLGLALVLGACSNDGDDTSDPGPAASGPCAVLGGLATVVPDEGATTTGDQADEAASPSSAADPGGEDAALRVLLFTRTEEYRHDSIVPAVEWFETLDDEGLEVTTTEETDVFTTDGLAAFDVVAFVNTTGDVLDPAEQDAFQTWLEAGGGFVGVHAAADTEHDWAWYGDALGASFSSHPFVFQTVTVTNEWPDHPTVASFEPTFTYTDEWYNFDRNARHTSDVLLSIDESSGTYVHNGEPVTEFTQGDDHPVAWTRQAGEGRVWYTALGHLPENWEDPAFLDHVLAGVRWSAEPDRYRRTVITDEVDAPVAVEVADSGLVLWAERGGAVKVWDPATGLIHTAGTVPSRIEGEGGLMGLRLAPDAAETGHLYVYATLPADDDPASTSTSTSLPATAPGEDSATTVAEGEDLNVDIGEGVDPDGIDDLLESGEVGTNALMRLTLGRDCTLDLADDAVETVVEVPNQFSGHQAGDIEFMADGTILLTTGDNTDNVTDDQAPLGGTGVAETMDARRTSGNPDDLRGKILRIEPDGSVPDGNLYPADGSAGRPEVYVSGVRNPYRVAVHPDSGRIWFGDIGPDSIAPGARGPQGFDEVNTAGGPGDHGWPYCIADNRPYNRFDLGTGEMGEPYDCSGKVEPVLAYDYVDVADPALGAGFRTERYGGDVIALGRSMMVGPWYRPTDGAAHALPIDDVLILHEFSRNLLLAAEVDGNGDITGIRSIAPWAGINTPIDVEVGPDGALYVIEYGQWNAMTAGTPSITRLDHSATGDFVALPPARPAPAAVADGDEEVADGPSVFQINCSSCHGNAGQGGIGPPLQGVADRLGPEEVAAVVSDGRGQMPAWGGRLTAEQIDAVVAYVQTLVED